MSHHRPDRLAWIILIVLAVVWGSSFILIKRGLFHEGQPVLDPVQLASARLFIAWLALSPWLFKHFRHFKTHWRYLLLAALLGNGIPAFLFAIAQSRISSSLSGMLNSLTPLMTLLIGVLFYGRNMRPIHMAGILLGLTGAAALILVRTGDGMPGWSYYAVLVVIATVCYGASGNVIKHHLYALPATATASLALTFLGPLSLVVAIQSGVPGTLATDPNAWYSLGHVAILAVMSSAVALVLWNVLLLRTSAVWASSVTYLMPIVAIGWGVADGESMGLAELVLITVILCGVYLVHIAERAK